MQNDRATRVSGAAGTESRLVRAWDLPTRLFHWSLVTLVVLAWVSRKWGDAGLVWHTWNGYAILVLIVWRVLWGFLGTSTARFGGFFYSPAHVLSYATDFLMRRPRHFLGHNPLGGGAVFLMLGLIGVQAVLGLYSYDDHDSLAGGPLSSRVSDAIWGMATRWHIWLFDVILAITAVHALVNIVVYPLWRGENIVKPMLTGNKAAGNYEDEAEARVAPTGRALLCLLAALGLVFGGIVALGGKVI